MQKFRWAARRMVFVLGTLIALLTPLLIDVVVAVKLPIPTVEASLRHAGECLIFLTHAGGTRWLQWMIAALVTALPMVQIVQFPGKTGVRRYAAA